MKQALSAKWKLRTFPNEARVNDRRDRGIYTEVCDSASRSIRMRHGIKSGRFRRESFTGDDYVKGELKNRLRALAIRLDTYLCIAVKQLIQEYDFLQEPIFGYKHRR